MANKRSYLLMLISILFFWQLAIKISGFPPFLLPTPLQVGAVLVNEWQDFLRHSLITISESLLGYIVANIVAVSLAISFLYLPWLESFLTPWMVLIKNVPFITVASILIILFGDSPIPTITIIVLICFFSILANLTKGLKSPEQVLLDRMRVLNASKWEVFVKVRWPSAMPYYIAAHEISFTGSIIGAIVAEWMFAKKGLGFLLARSILQIRADKVYAVTIISLLLAIGAFFVVKAIEHEAFKWKESVPEGASKRPQAAFQVD